MAFMDTLSKAKSAREYSKKEIASCVNEESKVCFQEIRTLKQEIKTVKNRLKKQNLQSSWENCQEICQSIEEIKQDLEQVLVLKESLLNILRSSEATSDNSLCLKREIQADFIETFQDLIQIVESKQSHIANLTWISNQNWTTYGQDLEQVNKKLLHIEASLDKTLQEIKTIKK